MSIRDKLAELDALRERATQIKWAYDLQFGVSYWLGNNAGDYIVALVNAYPALASELRRLAEENLALFECNGALFEVVKRAEAENEKLTRCLRNIERIGSADGEPADIGPEAAIDLAQTFARATLAAAGEKGAGKR